MASAQPPDFDNLPPNERPRPRVDENAVAAGAGGASSVPTWVWTFIGVIVLLGILGGAMAGFMGGQVFSIFKPQNRDVYALLGARLRDRSAEVRLEDVIINGPAGSAGILEGDRVEAIEGTQITSVGQAERIISNYDVGDAVVFTIERAYRFEQITVILGIAIPLPPTLDIVTIQPPTLPPIQPPYSQQQDEGRLGVRYRMLLPEDEFGVENGALVQQIITPGGPAEQAGIEVGDIILRVGAVDLAPPLTLLDALSRYSAGDRVRLQVLRNKTGETLEITVTLGSP